MSCAALVSHCWGVLPQVPTRLLIDSARGRDEPSLLCHLRQTSEEANLLVLFCFALSVPVGGLSEMDANQLARTSLPPARPQFSIVGQSCV